MNSHKETHHFDAELTDSEGRKLPVDCKVELPSIWGEIAAVEIAIPHSAMPIERFLNPCELQATMSHDSDFRLEMNDIWYRNLTTAVVPARALGSSLVTLTHVSAMRCIQNFAKCDNSLRVYISSPDFLNFYSVGAPVEEMVEELSAFRCPNLGLIRLQRYWISSSLKGARGFLSKAGYSLELEPGSDELETEKILHLIEPVLGLMSLFFRQRIMALGWEAILAEKRERYWQYPLEPLRTAYISVEPKRYLVNIQSLAGRMETALSAYHGLTKLKRNFFDRLNHSLRPASKIGDGEWFMAMFRDLEFVACRSASPTPLNNKEELALEKLRRLAEEFRDGDPIVSDRIAGFANKMRGGVPPITQNIATLLQEYGVRLSDLWEISGTKGLVQIRNKLAHRGANRVHHQALAVATFHLTLLNERLAHSILGIEVSGDATRSGRDEWLQRCYVERLKKCVFNVE